MRWKVILAASAVILVTAAPFANAQVPVTVTMAATDESPVSPVDSVKFFWPDTVLIGIARRPPAGVRQRTVGIFTPTSRFTLRALVYLGEGKPKENFLSFDYRDTCTAQGVDNHLERVACSIQKRGNDLVCTAFYAGMEKPLPECGSHSCKICNRVEICGAGADCP